MTPPTFEDRCIISCGMLHPEMTHLVDEDGQGWDGDDHQPYDGLYPTSDWGAGEMVRDTFSLTVPADAPPGLYDVQLGWYDPATDKRLAVGQGTAFRVAVLPVDWAVIEREDLIQVGERFGEAITLEGYASTMDAVALGVATEPEVLWVTLRWSTDDWLQVDYTVFVHLLGEGELVVAQRDTLPGLGRLSTMWLQPGVRWVDRYVLGQGRKPGRQCRLCPEQSGGPTLDAIYPGQPGN